MDWWTNETTALTISGFVLLLATGYFESQRRKDASARETTAKLASVQQGQLTSAIADLSAHIAKLTERLDSLTETSSQHQSRIAQLGQATKTVFSD